ncbi:MAG TPA: M14 family metallopeptidase [Candidatus Polarisedimenticolia bacterium]|nr:M14 family metallopeptidase [Candidatus Polarisedimenticolia bacterium]
MVHGVGFLIAMMLAATTAAAPSWLTRAERTGFIETSRYEETLADCRRLEKDSPLIHVTSFGTSPEGRDLILVIASKDRAFTPAAAAKTGKPIVLIQAGIHAGEIDGKDAGLMLLRDITTGPRLAGLLDHAIILFMPIYNVDGHERFGPYNRINQTGPKEQGWRTTSRNLNLNRDYVKADAVETRAWLKVFTSWWPDLTIDCHVTDGTDYQYDLTYGFESGPNVAPSVAWWIEATVNDHVVPALTAGGHMPSPYIFLKDDLDPAAGLQSFGPSPPRFSTGYTVLQNRPSFLVETHMLKDYRTRVLVTYDTLVAFLEEVNRDPDALRDAVRAADALAARPGSLPLKYSQTGTKRQVPYKGVEYRREPSEVSGAMRVTYGKRPLEMMMEMTEGIALDVVIEKPSAYIVPPQWREAIEVLKAHGLKLSRLTTAVTGAFDGYRLTEPVWKSEPFEGRHQVAFKTERLKGQTRTFPAGSIVVPMDQRSSTVASHLLEPQAPDSFVSWGFFDAIFEQKEFAEAYVLETLAREMMQKDPELKAEFEKALSDPNFASSPTKRLDFFYRRSPWWDDRIGLYPVGIVPSPRVLPVEPLP